MYRWAPMRGHSLTLILVGICFGLLLQVQVHAPAGSTRESSYEQARVQAAIQQLEEEQIELKRAVGRLRARLERYQQSAASESEMLRELKEELVIQRMRAGLVAFKGPGVVIRLDDSEATTSSLDRSLNPYIVHEYDVRDVVNLMWLAGAEGVAVNDERIVATTSIYCVGSTIMVNDIRLSPPYLVRAIGDPEALYAVATDPAYLVDLRRRVQQQGLKLTVERREEVMLPSYKRGFTFKYARTGVE